MTWLWKLLDKMSPEIVVAFKGLMGDLLKTLYQQALKTPNKWDDKGVEIMAAVFDVELPESET